jgi:hypothetical protein
MDGAGERHVRKNSTRCHTASRNGHDSLQGREAIASMEYKVARSKTALDDGGKKLVADLKQIPKKIDAERKRVRDPLDA